MNHHQNLSKQRGRKGQKEEEEDEEEEEEEEEGEDDNRSDRRNRNQRRSSGMTSRKAEAWITCTELSGRWSEVHHVHMTFDCH